MRVGILNPAQAPYALGLQPVDALGYSVTGDASGFVYLAKSIKAFPDQKGFTRMLKNAGFSRVEYTNVTFGVAAVHIAYKE